MVSAHDLFTYGEINNGWPNNWLLNSYKGLWKCQDKNEEELYTLGIRMFDARVFWDSDEKAWRGAHGLAEFKHIKFSTLDALATHFDNLGTENDPAFYRIVLEKDDNDGVNKFKSEAKGLCSKHKNLWTLLIKSQTNNWLNDSGCVENNIDSLVKRGYTFANHIPWESPNKEYNVAPPNFNFSNISTYADFNIRDHAYNGFKDKNGTFHPSNPDPITKDMLTNKTFVYNMDYCYNYIDNKKECMSFKRLEALYGVTASVYDKNRIPTKKELTNMGFKINGTYSDNQLVKGEDISK